MDYAAPMGEAPTAEAASSVRRAGRLLAAAGNSLVTPLRLLLVVAALIIAGIWISLRLALSQPYLGLRLEAQDGAVAIAAVDGTGPSAAAGTALQPGTRILALRSGPAGLLPLEAGDLVEDPDFLTRYADYRRFFARQQQLAQWLRGGALQAQTAGDGWVALRAAPARPLASLPFAFWFQLLFGVVSLAAGCAVYAAARSFGAWLYALSGTALFVVGLTAAVYSTRELALPGAVFQRLSMIDDFAALSFTGAFLSLLWVYPRPLAHFPAPLLILAAYATVAALHVAQRMGTIDNGYRLPIAAGVAAGAAFSLLQWRRARHHPVERAAFRYFFMVWFSGCLMFFGCMYLPLILGYQPPLSQSYMFGWLLLVFLVIPLGIIRYRLFDLDRWWFAAWSWFLGGLAVFALDALLVTVFGLEPPTATLGMLAAVGWLYLPLRERLWQWVTRERRRSRGERFAEAARRLLAAQQQPLAVLWSEGLRQLYAPLSSARLEPPPAAAAIAGDGLRLRLPGPAGVAALELVGAERGRRLFDRDDLADAARLGILFEHVAAARRSAAQTLERGRLELEIRERVYRDLHDDLGAKLLSLVYGAADSRNRDLALTALQDLRETVSRDDRIDPRLAEALSQWRAESEQRFEAAGVAFDWHTPEADAALRIRADLRTALGRVLREAVSNAIRHARPQRAVVEVAFDDGCLRLCLRHDGVCPDPATWQAGRGISNMQLRLGQFGGAIRWQLEGGGQWLSACWQVPLAPAAEPPGTGHAARPAA